GHMLEIGSNQFIPGFEEGLVGMKKGESREVTISFPADYHVEKLRSQPVTFKVDLQDIKTKVLPELNDEFFGKVNAKSLEDFKQTLRNDIEMQKKNVSETNLREAIIRAFVEANPVEVPKSLFEANREAIIEDYRNRLKSQGISDDDFSEFQKQSGMDFDSAAKFTVQAGFLTDQLAKEENIRATEKDVDDRLGEMAAKWGMEKAQIKKFYSERKGLDQLQNQMTEEKVYDFLIKNAQIEEVDQIAKKD
ncbi:MAG: trigger factor, partial [Bdellovibrionales bacterium]|nr:trigger factor [Bdellovibrionales bacterium]